MEQGVRESVEWVTLNENEEFSSHYYNTLTEFYAQEVDKTAETKNHFA